MSSTERNNYEEKNRTEQKKKRRKPNANFYAVLAVALGLIGVLLLLSVVFPRQDATRRRLEAERESRRQELLELQLEEESLQELAALMTNRDYLARYLREHQLYLKPGDIRIDLSSPDIVIPTPRPAEETTPEPTMVPTPDPFATEDPEGSEAPEEPTPSPEG